MLTVDIVGQNVLYPNRWNAYVPELSPEEQAEARLFKLPDGRLGMPASHFKSAIIQACRFFVTPSMLQCKLLVFIDGEADQWGTFLVPIYYAKKELQTTELRDSQGRTALYCRYCLYRWCATLHIRYMEPLTPALVTALLDAAGHGGVGDWRPSGSKTQTGTYGTFRVCEYPGL